MENVAAISWRKRGLNVMNFPRYETLVHHYELAMKFYFME
jgi:hypothetical protein